MAAEAIKFFRELIPDPPAPGTATDPYKDQNELAYVLSQVPFKTPRRIRVVVAGAGISGLSYAHEVEAGILKNASLTIYEKNGSVGGTWYENRYPGCACDIPVHNYQYSWAPNPHFPSYYAEGEHIQNYLEDVADQKNLRQYVKTSHKIIGAKWIEERQKWQVKVIRTDKRELVISSPGIDEGEVGDAFIDECDIFINATGCFNNWKWPSIPNRERFRGEVLHSARWPKETNLQGRTVALIGNGSTGVQILPAIIDKVDKVYVFMRSKTWVTAAFAQKYAGPGGTNKVFSEEEKSAWAESAEAYLAYRKSVEEELNSRFKLYIKDFPEQAAARKFSVDQMTDKLASKPDVLKLILPDYAVGCRRPTPGNGYLEALCHEKCTVVWGEIEEFTETGLKSASDGKNYEVDTIICATGFNMSFSPRFPVLGQHGVDLQKKWDVNPEAYLSVTAAAMPNYFIYLGPASPLGHGSVVASVEKVTGYITLLVKKLQTENYGSCVPKPHIPAAYQKQSLAWLTKTSWSTGCVSTFKNGRKDGKLVSLHAGSRLQYFEMLENPRYEDFDWTSLCPDPDLTFAWMANGFTVAETEKVTDLTYFLTPVKKEDHIRKSTRMANLQPKGHEEIANLEWKVGTS